MFHIIYNLAREPIEEKVISIDEAVKIIQEKGIKNQVLTLQGRLLRLPLVEERVSPGDLVEKIRGFFGTNLAEVTATSQLHEGLNGGAEEHYLHLERDHKKLVVKYLD